MSEKHGANHINVDNHTKCQPHSVLASRHALWVEIRTSGREIHHIQSIMCLNELTSNSLVPCGPIP